jgi:hypothetical protein
MPFISADEIDIDPADRIASALDLISQFGSIDGAHHKQWTLDQVVRALTGCPTETHAAIDCNGESYTYPALGESHEYLQWVKEHCEGEDGPQTYEWDVGVAP